MNLTSAELIPVIIIVAGGVLYHVAQKATPHGVDPFLALFVSFGLASLACLGLALARGHASAAQFRAISWTSFGLAAALVGIESGYLIGYRNGLQLNLTSFACNNMIAIVLVGLGALMYGERMTLRNTAGAVLCLGGLLLLRF
jgi:drug/metabolite transporter (DMT)-like permease